MGMDWKALAFDQRAPDLDRRRVRLLKHHPVRLLGSFLQTENYYGAKKHALDKAAAKELAGKPWALFHGWSGECVRSLRAAKERGIPSLIEIPTWHRNKGKDKPSRLTKSERERAALKGIAGWKASLLVTRQQMIEEYDLADLILVLSQKAEETFLAGGLPQSKLFRHQRGVDVTRFTPAESHPDVFRCVFVGSVIKRKGVHHLLEVWRKLGLKNAELVLAGTVHREIQPYLAGPMDPSIHVLGFAPRIENIYRTGAVHVFPSECEGSAKCTYEAAACGLAQITTRESGDVVQDGVNGIIIPPNDPDALAAALEKLYQNRDLCRQYGAAGRQRVVENFTWDHFRERLAQAYLTVLKR